MLRCWWCTLKIEFNAKECPVRKEADKLITIGKFCSLSCVKSFAMKESFSDPVYSDSVRLIQLFNGDVKPALGFQILREYGGYMNPEEFKSLLTF